MKGLRIIPAFLLLILLAYLGILFIEANRQEVVVVLGHYSSPQSPLGFAILTSFFLGMVFASLFFMLELGALYFKVRQLRRRVAAASKEEEAKAEAPVPELQP